MEVEENMKIQRDLVKKPMPSSITEFKNHPLFALRRHLLKFEAIYPNDQKPLGMIKVSIEDRLTLSAFAERGVIKGYDG